MISVEEAQARILALKEPVAVETVLLAEAAGRWAADDIVALRTQPARDLSAMDGYAIRFADADGPWTIIGESAAGKQFAGSVCVGEAVRIFTGALIPDGATGGWLYASSQGDNTYMRFALPGMTPAGLTALYVAVSRAAA